MNPVEYVAEKAGTGQPPTLDAHQLESIVERAARRDTDGNAPFSDDWTPTYDLNAAVAEALETRAALVLTRFDLTVDGQTLRREQMHKSLMAAAKMYRNRVVGTVRRDPPVEGQLSQSTIIGGK